MHIHAYFCFTSHLENHHDSIELCQRPASSLDGVPMGQPALSLAAQLLRRAQRAGAPPSLADAAPDPADDAAGMGGLVAGAASGAGGELGQELLALVARAQALGLDPELELRAAARAYADRVRAWEATQPT